MASPESSDTLAAILRQGEPAGSGSGLTWLIAGSDIVAAVAYLAIPVVLYWLLRKRTDAPLQRTIGVFALMFLAGGIASAIRSWAAPHTTHWVVGAFTALAALGAVGALAALVRAIPLILKLPSPDDLERANQSLEARVAERTRELEQINERMRTEVEVREHAESQVRTLNEKVSEQLDELRTLIDLLPVAVAIADDVECRKLWGNVAMNRILRVSPGANFSMASENADAPSHFQVWQRGRLLHRDELLMQTVGREGRAVSNFEETIVHDDGTRIDLIGDGMPLRRADGSVRGVVGVFRDVSDLKRTAEERLMTERKTLEAHKMQSIGRLAAGVAHDFNNLLAVIKGAVELLASEQDASGSATVPLDMASAAINRASDLCQQMLAYAGEGRVTLQNVSINACVHEAVSLMRNSTLRQHEIELQLDPSVGSLRTDASQIVQVVVNLINNAIEASEEATGPICVSTRVVDVSEKDIRDMQPADSMASGRCDLICVEDHGHGMDGATIKQLFTPFFSTRFKGRGLGLAAVLGVARSHRGGVRVISRPGEGTRAEVFFPREAPAAPELPAERPVVESVGERPRCVLVVDDEPMMRRVVSTLVERKGFDVETVSSGYEALEKLGTRSFGLVLLDLAMPDLDGYDTFLRIREMAPSTAVVLMTGCPRRDVAERITDLRPDAILSKPFETGLLSTVLDGVFSEAK